MLAFHEKHLGLALFAGALAASCLALPASSYAQANRGSTTSGMFGSSTLGSTGGASPQGLGQGMTTGMGGSSQQGGSGQGGANSSSSMQSAMVTGGGPVNLQAGGSTGFVGISSRNNQQAFNASGQGGTGNQNFNMLQQLATKSRQNQFNAQQAQKAGRTTGTQASAQFRVPLRLGFQPPAAPNAPLPKLQNTITKVPGLTKLGPIEATLEGTTAVLRGRVATEADRQLADGLARLEPGIVAVRNELVVGSAAATTTEPLPSPATP
ncbi:MAG: BON domain-containing protein [Planctomycetia bacterium]|nr:BON domain-containing protein [Planctomycetia bacterium]